MRSNGMETKVGTHGSKEACRRNLGSVALEAMLCGIYKKRISLTCLRILSCLTILVVIQQKILNQFLDVNEAMKAYAARKLNNGKLDVSWHIQDFGKSYSMLSFAQKICRKFKD